MSQFGPPPGGFGYPQQQGYPQPGYPQQGFGGGPGPAGYPMGPPSTHPLAIVSLIAGILVCMPGAGIAAVVCGFIGRSAIAKEPARYTGGGMAMAGIVLGFLHLAGWVLYVLLVIVLGVVGAATGGR
jgi:hypothetical protein